MHNPFETREIWFLTGSQGLYGPETLEQVATQSREIAETLDAAVAALSALPHITDVRASPRAVTTPVGGPPGQPDYLNQVVTLRTDLAPWELLAVAHRLEQDHHRRREVRWGARTLDVDVDAVLAQAQAEADELAAEVRRALESLVEDGAERLFDEIYAEPHQELERQRREHALYLQQFDDEEAGA